MRLTHKYKYKTDNKRFVFDMKDYRRACQKLGQLEDWMEMYGVLTMNDLHIFLKWQKEAREYNEKNRAEIEEYYKIERELGISLITLFKALEKGFYYRAINEGCPDEIWFADPNNECCGIECYGSNSYGITWAGVDVAYTRDHGKTWALTKEELEYEKENR